MLSGQQPIHNVFCRILTKMRLGKGDDEVLDMCYYRDNAGEINRHFKTHLFYCLVREKYIMLLE